MFLEQIKRLEADARKREDENAKRLEAAAKLRRNLDCGKNAAEKHTSSRRSQTNPGFDNVNSCNPNTTR